MIAFNKECFQLPSSNNLPSKALQKNTMQGYLKLVLPREDSHSYFLNPCKRYASFPQRNLSKFNLEENKKKLREGKPGSVRLLSNNLQKINNLLMQIATY